MGGHADRISVLILCAGEARRFGGEVKQLLTIGSDTILGRTLKQTAHMDPVVVTHLEEIKQASPRWFEPEHRQYTVDTLRSTRKLWGHVTVVLLGDVLYSDETMRDILGCEETTVFGDKWEVYAVVFTDHYQVLVACGEAMSLWPCKLGNLYNALCGKPLAAKRGLGHEMEGEPMFHYVEDWTRDIDGEGQYLQALKELRL